MNLLLRCSFVAKRSHVGYLGIHHADVSFISTPTQASLLLTLSTSIVYYLYLVPFRVRSLILFNFLSAATVVAPDHTQVPWSPTVTQMETMISFPPSGSVGILGGERNQEI